MSSSPEQRWNLHAHQESTSVHIWPGKGTKVFLFKSWKISWSSSRNIASAAAALIYSTFERRGWLAGWLAGGSAVFWDSGTDESYSEARRRRQGCRRLQMPVVEGRIWVSSGTHWNCYYESQNGLFRSWDCVQNESISHLFRHSSKISVDFCNCDWGWLAEDYIPQSAPVTARFNLEHFWHKLSGRQNSFLLLYCKILMSKSKNSKHKVQRSITEQFCSNWNAQAINCHLEAKERQTVFLKRTFSDWTHCHWYDLSFKGFFCFCFFTSSASLLTLKLNPAAGTSELFPLPLSVWGWCFLWVEMAPATTHLTPRTTPDPSPNPCVTATLWAAHSEACIMLEDISSPLHLAWGAERRPLSLQFPGAELDKSHHTQRDLRHESWRIFMRFKSVYSLFCLLENSFMWKKKRRTLLQIEQKLAPNLARSATPWRVWLLLQAGCSTVKV